MYVGWPVANAKPDMLLVNGDATVYEIKTPFDSPQRIDAQLAEYYRCFASVNVVVQEQEADRYMKILPRHVGVLALTPRFTLSIRRPHMKMIEKLDHASMIRLLHEKECYNAVSDSGLDFLGISPAKRYSMARDRFISLPIMEAYDHVISALRRRDRTKRLAGICNKLPKSLYVSAFSYSMLKREWRSLIDMLSESPNPIPKRANHVFSLSQRKAG